MRSIFSGSGQTAQSACTNKQHHYTGNLVVVKRGFDRESSITPATHLLGLLTTKIFMFPAAAAYVFASFWPLRLLPGAFLRPGSLQTHKRKSSRPLNSYSIRYCKFVCCSLFAFSLYVLSNIENGKATSKELKNFRFIRELYSVKKLHLLFMNCLLLVLTGAAKAFFEAALVAGKLTPPLLDLA
jgi:hypothetical protein